MKLEKVFCNLLQGWEVLYLNDDIDNTGRDNMKFNSKDSPNNV